MDVDSSKRDCSPAAILNNVRRNGCASRFSDPVSRVHGVVVTITGRSTIDVGNDKIVLETQLRNRVIITRLRVLAETALLIRLDLD